MPAAIESDGAEWRDFLAAAEHTFQRRPELRRCWRVAHALPAGCRRFSSAGSASGASLLPLLPPMRRAFRRAAMPLKSLRRRFERFAGRRLCFLR